MEQEESGFGKVPRNGQFAHRDPRPPRSDHKTATRSSMIDFKTAITQDLAEIDLVLGVLNSLRDTNMARLELLNEAEKREH
jgi:hypothetical protein